MLQHYSKLVLRNLGQIRNQSLLNILGLSLGLASCLLLLNYLQIEFNFDRHHQPNLYRVSSDLQFADTATQTATASPAIAAGLKRDFSEVIESTRVFKVPGVEKFLVSIEDHAYFEEKVLFADPSFFDLLHYDFVLGDSDTALDGPFSVVISEEIAGKLFPEQIALGQSIEIESNWGKDLYTITGVFDKDAFRTHIDGDYYVSAMSGAIGDRFYELQEWGGNNLFYTFIQLDPGSDPLSLEQKLPEWLNTYTSEQLTELGFSKTLFLEAMPDLYLYSGLTTMIGPTGSATYFTMLGIIAVLILVIACINFTNLATAKALLRAKEVGIRKVVGAHKSMLLQQFMFEAFIYTVIAVTVAYQIANLAAPLLGATIGTPLSIGLFNTAFDSGVLLSAIVVTTLMIGAYPALFLASFNPIDTLKGIASGSLKGKTLRRVLVIVQFTVSIALVQGILIINEQMRFIENYDLGFDRRNKLIIPNNGSGSKENLPLLKNALLQHPDIVDAGSSSTYPSAGNFENGMMNSPGRPPEQAVVGYTTFVQPDYLELMDFEFVSGRNFDIGRSADSIGKVVVNESLARSVGYDTDSAIGQTIFYDIPDRRSTFEIIGVVKDFNAFALYNQIEGQAFFWDEENALANNYLVADFSTRDLAALIAFVEASWKLLNTKEPFEYFLMNDAILEDYETEQRMSGLIVVATTLAFMLSCFGLHGLASFSAERRKKEIAIRKTLGAEVTNVVFMLSKDFLQLVLIAIVIATPMTWYAMSQWLSNFYYHTELAWWIFIGGGLTALLIALVAISWQAISAAVLNPVQGLRAA